MFLLTLHSARCRRQVRLFKIPAAALLAVCATGHNAFAAAPATLTAAVGDQETLLTWSSVASATTYTIYRKLPSSFVYSLVAAPPATAGNAYVDIGLTNGTAYNYVVTATVAGVESSYSPLANATPLAQDANWKITPPSTQILTEPSVASNSTTVSDAMGSTLLTSAGVYGANLSTSTSASYPAGTWTFQWTGTSWPTLYVIKHQQKYAYAANIGGGNGSATVKITGGATLVSAVFPITGTAVFQAPATTWSFNTSDLTHPVQTSTTSSHIAGAGPAPGTTSGANNSWSEASYNSVIATMAYTSQYFQAHYSTPQSISISLPSLASNISVSSSLSSAVTAGNSVATASVADVYAGQ